MAETSADEEELRGDQRDEPRHHGGLPGLPRRALQVGHDLQGQDQTEVHPARVRPQFLLRPLGQRSNYIITLF